MRITKLALGMALGFSMTALAEPHENTPLVNPLPESGRANAVAKICPLKGQLDNKLVYEDSEKMVTKMLVAVSFLNTKYQLVRESKAMQEIPIATGSSGEFIKSLLEWHNSITRSAGSSKDSPNVSGYIVATLPPALVGIVGLATYTNSSATTPLPTATDRKIGRLLMSGAALSVASIYSARSSGAKSLQYSSGELSLSEQKVLQDGLEQGLYEPAKLLGDTLGWNADHRARFTQALRKKVIETFETSVKGMEKVYVDSGHDNMLTWTRLQTRLVGNLAKIDFNEILEKEKLLTGAELQALKNLQALQDRGNRIKSEMTPSQIKKVLKEKTGVDSNLYSLARFHRLLEQVQSELPKEGAAEARAEVAKLIEESAKGIATLKMLCDIGVD